MGLWSWLAGSIITLVAIPVCVELLISYIKGDPYSLPRAAVVLAAVAVVLTLLMSVRALSRQLHFALGLALMALGLTTTVTGVLAMVAETARATHALNLTVVFLGLLISTFAGLVLYVDRHGADLLFAIKARSQVHITDKLQTEDCSVSLSKYPSFDASDEEVLALCRTQVNPDDVHFIGYYVNGSCRFHVDVLDNSQLNRFFRGSDREQRRSAYERAGRQLHWIISRLNIYVRQLDGGILIRTVLDIEEGGLYHYWIDKNVQLIGVTMDQPKVLEADEKLRRLANRIGRLPRGATPRQDIVQQVVTAP
ncbi:MAG: hypothetical protein ACRDS1_08660 [Pseudonocardiaceae bacterium]